MRHRLSVPTLALAAMLGAWPLAAQQPDTTKVTADKRGTPFFRGRDAVVAAGFVAGTVVFSRFDQRLASTFQDPKLQESTLVKDGATFFQYMGSPGSHIISASVFLVGRVTKNRQIAALGLHAFEGISLADGITFGIKGLGGRARPYVHVDTLPDDFQFFRGFRTSGSDYKSFPSGHATSAFAAAAAVTGEVYYWTGVNGWWAGWPWVVGSTLFTGATLVGVSRMYKDAHWASDVVAGAAIGTFSGFKVVRYAYRHPQNRLDRWLLPGVAPDGRGAMMLVWTMPTGPAAAP